MAVVPMQKVRAIVHQPAVDDFLSILQRFGAMEFTDVTHDTLSESVGVAPHTELLPRVQHAVGFLEPYEQKRGLWRTLRDGNTTDYTEAMIRDRIADTDGVSATVADVEALQVELAEKTARQKHLEEQRALLLQWAPVQNSLAQMETALTHSVLVAAPEKLTGTFADTITRSLQDVTEAYTFEIFDANVALITVAHPHTEAAMEAFANEQMVVITQPEGSNTPAIELAAVEEQLAGVKSELGVLHDQAEHTAKLRLGELRIVSEILEWERDRYATLSAAKRTTATVVFDGWIREDQQAVIESELQSTGVPFVFSSLEVAAGEEPPVEIKNSALVAPFEVVTRLYGMPGHRDLDPTLFLAGFFFLFFGLSLTDVGYGITLLAVAGIVLTFFKVSPGVRTFMKLLLFMGLGSALLGMLFGGYLGIPMEALPQWLQAIQLFDPIANPLPVFYLALGLGVVQVMFGMLLKVYSEYRNGRLMDGLMDQGPWLALFVIGIVYLGVAIGQITFVTTDTLINVVYVDLALIALAASRKGDGVVGKIIAVLAALYNDTIGYFSDILSYSRLLALGLATSALAFAVNLIAELVSGTPVVGPILAVAILVIGHLFALVINTLGAFIHSARLQFVEFFGKFISGSGRAFSPLSRSSRYITARKE